MGRRRTAAAVLGVGVASLAVIAFDDGWLYAADLLGGVLFGGAIVWLWTTDSPTKER